MPTHLKEKIEKIQNPNLNEKSKLKLVWQWIKMENINFQEFEILLNNIKIK